MMSAISSLLLSILILAPLPLYADHAVNINTADQAALVTLIGIGEVKAKAIIDYRLANGPFTAKEDIQDVSGIGPAIYEDIKDHIALVSEPAKETPKPLKPVVAEKSIESIEKEVVKESAEEPAEHSAVTTSTSTKLQVKTSTGELLDRWAVSLGVLISIGATGAFFASRAGRKDWQIIEEQ